MDLLDRCSNYILGTNDFTFFSKDNPDIKNKKCEVYLSKWIEIEHGFLYEIQAIDFCIIWFDI